MMARELMNLVGINIDWICTPAANCFRTGNHLGIQPHGFKDSIDFAVDELEELTGVRVEAPINKKGAEILFIAPSADYFASPHYYTLLGYLALFHEIGLDYTWSSFASEGGNFGLFHSYETMKRLNAKMYMEAKRLGFSGDPGIADYGDEVRECQVDQDGAYHGVYVGSYPQRQAEA
jgi:hypothetical protein